MPDLAAAERVLAGRTGAYLTQAGVSFAGPSPVAAFQDGISEALTACGSPAADPSAVTDADVARLANARWAKFLDVAELRVLESAGGALMSKAQSQRWTNYTVMRDQISFGQYLDSRRKAVRLKWNYGVAPLSAGTVDLNFAQKAGEF